MERARRPLWSESLMVLSVVATVGTAIMAKKIHEDTTKLTSEISLFKHQMEILEVAECIDKNNQLTSSKPSLTLEECRRINMIQFSAYQNGGKFGKR